MVLIVSNCPLPTVNNSLLAQLNSWTTRLPEPSTTPWKKVDLLCRHKGCDENLRRSIREGTPLTPQSRDIPASTSPWVRLPALYKALGLQVRLNV